MAKKNSYTEKKNLSWGIMLGKKSYTVVRQEKNSYTNQITHTTPQKSNGRPLNRAVKKNNQSNYSSQAQIKRRSKEPIRTNACSGSGRQAREDTREEITSGWLRKLRGILKPLRNRTHKTNVRGGTHRKQLHICLYISIT